MKTMRHSRRQFLRQSATTSVALAFPTIIPSGVLGANAPSTRVRMGCIGVGRMGRGDARDFLRLDQVEVVAVCDVDTKRLADGRRMVEDHYTKAGRKGAKCAEYVDFRELLARDDIDAVSIVTPDHWHALGAVAAARSGKDIFLQKPLTYTIAEGRVLSDTVKQHKRVLQVGSQQRSDPKFRLACELVRNGMIGDLELVKIGFGLDPAGDVEPTMPVPENLNYDLWLGPAPEAPYTEKRVHPQKDYGRPGWLRIQDYCHGMITGWGSHHVDIAHWGMGMEYSGPTRIEGSAVFPDKGLWDVHTSFTVEYTYPNGVRVICAGNEVNKQGVEFIGSRGWVHVQRGRIDAHPKSLLQAEIPTEGRLYRSDDHKRNFLDCIRTRKTPVAPVEIGHRSNSACVLGAIAMRLKRPLEWDPKTETFLHDEEANGLRSRAMRGAWKL